MAVTGDLSPGSRGASVLSHRVSGPALPTALAAGLVLTAGVWLFAAFYSRGEVRALEREAAEVSRRYLMAQELLGQVRSRIDRASVYLRDALLDPNPAVDQYRSDVDAAYGQADALLATYVPVLDSESERRSIERLRRDIRELQRANHDFLAIDGQRWHSHAETFLRGEVTPRRDAAIRVSEDLQRLNRNAYVTQQAEMARVYESVQQRFRQAVGFGVAATLVIGLVSAWHVRRLDRQLRERQERDAETAASLRELTSRLATAQEEERRLISRELHDEIGQILTAIKLELGHARRRLPDEATLLDDAAAIADQGLLAVRDMSHLLHPPQLEELGLSAAIDAYVRMIRRRHEMHVEVSVPATGRRLPADLERAVYRTIQEALTNVVRHARAKTCQVKVAMSPDMIAVSVSDDGVGFSPDPGGRVAVDSGLGLLGIRERVLQVGGRLRVESGPGLGTILAAEFPLPVETGPERATDRMELARARAH